MEVKKTHYDVLGLEPFSEASAIRKKYRELALLHHPDKSQSSEEFLPIQDSYTYLRDHKEEYDRDLRNDMLAAYSVEQEADEIDDYDITVEDSIQFVTFECTQCCSEISKETNPSSLYNCDICSKFYIIK
ncbi:unnamed protein product [Moneuplotes crassus]|uniref:J domain-containing protein n=1 Tax=Euplotes crassus TaxID=5936 RepID=A0AAD1Y463_EUPCR|nr:unnamed protein product [Moneuplotes crassus]